MAVRRRPLRRGHEPPSRPPGRVLDRRSVVHVRDPALGRVRAPRKRTGVRRPPPGRDRGRSGGARPDDGRHRRRVDGHRARACAGRAVEEALRKRRPRADPVPARMNVHQITPLPIAIPLLTAAAIVITSGAPRRVHDAMAMAAAAAMTVICAILLAHAGKGPIVEWLGGWRPHHGVALGISLAVDQLGAGAAVFVSVLLMATLAYSWTYFEELDGLVHALMLVLTAAMVGVCLTGDLFTMLVFFVLLTVP